MTRTSHNGIVGLNNHKQEHGSGRDGEGLFLENWTTFTLLNISRTAYVTTGDRVQWRQRHKGHHELHKKDLEEHLGCQRRNGYLSPV